MNVAQNLEKSAEQFPSSLAVVFEEQTFDYAAVNAAANRVGSILRGLGVLPGDAIAIFLPNIPDFVFAYFGILKLGAVVVSISSRLRYGEVKFILDDSQPKVIITSSELLGELPLDNGRVIVAVGDELPTGILSLNRLTADASPALQSADATADAPCAILYTSGTTGTPKGVVLSHGNVTSNVDAANLHCGIRQGQRMMVFLPLFHCFGQNAVMNCAIAAGATLILHRQFSPALILESIARNRVTHFYGVPTVFIHLLNMDRSTFDLSSVVYYFSAAAKMPLEVAQRWRQMVGLPIYEGYGLTETSPFSTYNHATDYRLGSVGTAIRDVEIGVVDEHDQRLSPGETGEIIVRGPNIMLGYLHHPEATAQAVRGGWFHTGDIGYMDDDGYVYVTDRLKDMINVSGLKVYPAEVENVIHQHSAVAEVAVYGLPDDTYGESVQANVVLKPDTSVSEEDLIGFCAERIAAYKVPRCIHFVTAIPKSPTGKVLKREIVAQALQSAAS